MSFNKITIQTSISAFLVFLHNIKILYCILCHCTEIIKKYLIIPYLRSNDLSQGNALLNTMVILLFIPCYPYISSSSSNHKTNSTVISIETSSVDGDVLAFDESMLAEPQFSHPTTPLVIKAVDERASYRVASALSSQEECFQRTKGRKTISGYLRHSTFKAVQSTAGVIPTQNYCKISTGLCQIPTIQAMTIVGLSSNTNLGEAKSSIPDISCIKSRPKKSFTFSCGPFIRPSKTPHIEPTKSVFSSLLVTSSSPNLSPQIYSTKSTTCTNASSFANPNVNSNLILNPVFENPRPHSLSIPVEMSTSSLKG